MTAAIPTLLTLATSLPEILPFANEDIHIEYTTGTVVCMDEMLPAEDDEEDEEEGPDAIQSELVQRRTAQLSVVITIGSGAKQVSGKEKGRSHIKGKGKMATISSEQDLDEMLTDSDFD